MGSLDFKGVARKVSNLRAFKKQALAAANQKFIREKKNLNGQKRIKKNSSLNGVDM